MLASLVLPSSGDLQCDHVAVDAITQQAVLVFSATASVGRCPLCQHPATRCHSRYQRTLADLPLASYRVFITLHVRKFFCANAACHRKIFTERLPAFVAASARRTLRLADTQTQLGVVLGGIAAARLSQRLRLPASRTTFLRLVRRIPLPEYPSATIIGVDDWALCKRQRYGSIIVDLERQHILDLLPDRTPETLATWLQDHPGIQIISRDRAPAYAEGARQGAPEAIQVADRFHLTQNLADTLRAVVENHAATLRTAVAPIIKSIDVVDIPARLTVGPAQQTRRDQRRTNRLQLYEQVKTLHAQHVHGNAIAAQTGVSVRTIRRWLKTTTFPERKPRPDQSTQLDPYKLYLLERWNAGCWNGSQLYREIKDQGYSGKAGSVIAYCVHLRKAQGTRYQKTQPPDHTSKAVPQVPPLTVNRAVWLIMRPPSRRTAAEQDVHAILPTVHPDLTRAILLTESFLAMVREHQGDQLGPWLEQADTSGLRPFIRFATSIRRDLRAVQAGLTLPWSTGPVEGHINRLKTLKRQMYGRASLDLLRRRLLAA